MSMWVSGALAVAAIGSSLYSSNAAAKSGAKQASAAAGAAARQGAAQTIAENEAVVRSNMQSTVRNSYKVGMMNLQMGLRKKQSIQQGHDITVQSQAVLGAATANQAATLSVGASTDAIVQDINMREGEARAQLLENYEADKTNFNNELEALTMSAEGEVQRARHFEYESPTYNGPSAGQMWGSALMAGASSFMGSYGAKRMSLDLGSTASTSQAKLGKNFNLDTMSW